MALKTTKTWEAGERIETMASLVQALSIFTAESVTEYYANSELRGLLSEVIEDRPDMRALLLGVIGVFGNGKHSLSPLPS
jgi:hypothetical protein